MRVEVDVCAGVSKWRSYSRWWDAVPALSASQARKLGCCDVVRQLDASRARCPPLLLAQSLSRAEARKREGFATTLSAASDGQSLC